MNAQSKNSGQGQEIIWVSVRDVMPDPDQPRKHFDDEKLNQLRIAMEALGQLVPVWLRPVAIYTEGGPKYILVDGERRWRAKSMDDDGAGGEVPQLKAILGAADATREYYEESCAFNFQREGHTPYEEILMSWTLVKSHCHTLNYVAILLGKSIAWVNQRVLAYERLAPEVMDSLKMNQIPVSVATTLSKLVHSEQITSLRKYLAGGSIAVVQATVRRAIDEGRTQSRVHKPDMHDDRRYVIKSASVFLERFSRHQHLGTERLQAVAASMSEPERKKMIVDLMEAGQQVVALIKIMKGTE